MKLQIIQDNASFILIGNYKGQEVYERFLNIEKLIEALSLATKKQNASKLKPIPTRRF